MEADVAGEGAAIGKILVKCYGDAASRRNCVGTGIFITYFHRTVLLFCETDPVGKLIVNDVIIRGYYIRVCDAVINSHLDGRAVRHGTAHNIDPLVS